MIEEKVLKLDKANWLPTKLGDLATEISKRVDNPGESEYDRFVGLGNFVSGDIKIKSWETTEGLASSAKAFEAGDILFARRNAYLRRASMVDFDGCCSGDAFVLRENQDKVVPGFLAFLLNSDALWDYANSNAAGTMSKRVKWRDLAEYEFLLPPKDQQVKLAELLWAMDDVVEEDIDNISNLNELKQSCLKEWLNKGLYDSDLQDSDLGLIPENWIVTNFAEALKEVKSGLSRRIVFEDIGIPVLISGNIQDGRLDTSELKYWHRDDPQGANVDNYILNKGDILLCFINSLSQIGKCCLYNDIGRDVIYTTNLFRIVPNDDLNNVFLNYLLSSKHIQYKLKQITMPAVNQASFTKFDFLRIKFSKPPLDEQIEISRKLEEIDLAIDKANQKLESSKSLQKSLINQVF